MWRDDVKHFYEPTFRTFTRIVMGPAHVKFGVAAGRAALDDGWETWDPKYEPLVQRALARALPVCVGGTELAGPGQCTSNTKANVGPAVLETRGLYRHWQMFGSTSRLARATAVLYYTEGLDESMISTILGRSNSVIREALQEVCAHVDNVITNGRHERTQMNLLVEAHVDQIFEYTSRNLGETRGKDAGQKTFIAMMKVIRNYNPNEGRFINWLYGVAHNHIRRERRPNRLDASREPLESIENLPGNDPRAELDWQLDLAQLRRVLDESWISLTADETSAVVLLYFKDLSVAEIAEIHGVPVGTVKSVLYRARQKLRPALARFECQ